MLGDELLDFGKEKNFMVDQWLAICWNIVETAATIHFSKIAQVFATLKLVDLHFRQRMSLKFETNLLLFWLMDKVTKFSSGSFPFVFEIIEAKDHVVGSF